MRSGEALRGRAQPALGAPRDRPRRRGAVRSTPAWRARGAALDGALVEKGARRQPPAPSKTSVAPGRSARAAHARAGRALAATSPGPPRSRAPAWGAVPGCPTELDRPTDEQGQVP